MPTLSGAYVRLFRAFERIAELTEDIYRNGAALSNAAGPDGDFDDLDAVSPMITVLIGDTVHSLRDTLDYLVYTLGQLDSGNPQPTARFPLCKTHEAFADESVAALAGLSDPHRERIAALQPYAGVEWTRALLDVSDAHAQRCLKLVAPAADPAAGLPTDSRILVFADGSPVVTTLGTIAREVSAVLEAFNADFA